MDVFQLFGTLDIDTSAYQQKMYGAYSQVYSVWSMLDSINKMQLNVGGQQTTQSMTQATQQSQQAAQATQQIGQSVQQAGTQIQQGAQTANQGWTVLKGIMSNLGTMAINKGLNFGKSFLQAGYEYNATVESEIAHFTTLLQTTKEDATSFFKELEQFAIDTPLSLTGASETATSMLGVGINREELIDTMQMLGDLALGDTEKMQGLAKALTDVKTNTTLLAQDARQFTNRGIPLYKMLTEYYDEMYWILDDGTMFEKSKYPKIPDEFADSLITVDERTVKMLQKQSSVYYEDVLTVLQRATSEGGMFYKGMDTAMQTAEGQAERLQDNYARTAGSVMKTVNAIFLSDTIPALNEILEKVDKWATENPEDIERLAQAFSDLATNGINVAVDSLTKLMDYWSEHRKEFDSLLVMLGGVAMTTGHPMAGAAMITVGGYDVWNATKEETEKAMKGFADGNDEEALLSMMMPDDIEAKLKSGYTPEQLSESERQTYENIKNTYNGLSLVSGLTSGFYSDEFLPMPQQTDWKSYFGLTEEEFAQMPKELQQWYLDAIGEMSDDGGGKRFGDAPAVGPENTEVDDWDNPFSFNFSDGSERWSVGGGGGGGLGGQLQFINDQTGGSAMQLILAAFQQLPAQIRAEVATAAQEGVANGMSGVTITGHITTGDVKLQDGTIVGALTPQINMQLGWMNKLSGRG